MSWVKRRENSERCVYQSDPRFCPSLGTMATLNVYQLIPWFSGCTLPSPKATCNTPVWLLDGNGYMQFNGLFTPIWMGISEAEVAETTKGGDIGGMLGTRGNPAPVVHPVGS